MLRYRRTIISALREAALSLFQTAVDRADPARALKWHWQDNPLPDLGPGRCFVVAVGKAAVPMINVALDNLPHVEEALVVTNVENAAVALIFGGETTVQVRGTGLGGRNQELALRVAMGAEDRLAPGWVFLSGGTDGRDGPTDAAGGVVDAGTLSRIRAAGGDPAALLANNDSFAALKLSEDLLITGGTGTNVADVQVFLRPTP